MTTVYRMKRIFVASLLTIVACVLLAGCSNKANIGYIDLSKIAECPQVKAINTEFEKEYAPLVGQMNELAQKQGSMAPEAYQKAVQDLQRKAMGIREKYASKRQSLIMNAVAEIAKEKNLSVVTVKSVAGINLQAPPQQSLVIEGTAVEGGTDITEDVVKKLQ